MITKASTTTAVALDFIDRNTDPRRHVLVNSMALARATNTEKRYLEQFLQKIRGKGWTTCKRGPDGGYRITQKGRDLTLEEFLKLFVHEEDWWQFELLGSPNDSYRQLIKALSDAKKRAA